MEVPDTVEAVFSCGLERLGSGDFGGAAACFRRVIELDPDLPEGHANLGVALEHTGSLDEAEACYERALELGPDVLQHHLNLGALRVVRKRLDSAGEVYARAADLFPDAPELWSNLGVLETCRHRHREAEACFRIALDLDPGYLKARFNLSYLLLRDGRFEEGWPALEARPWSVELTARIPGARWQGESLEGRALLIGSEGGHGDMIQFSRYAQLLKERGAARIGIVCHPLLERLFSTLPGVDSVMTLGSPIQGSWDAWTLPQSLPGLCGTRMDSIPAAIPYLGPLPGSVDIWRSRLPADGFLVGLAWKGNPRFENDADRSLPSLDLLAPLAARPGTRFVSLQRHVGEDEARRPPRGLPLLDPSHWIQDFADLAALLANLDLVISVDTAAAHLAGAMGKPCWILLPSHKTDWRWFVDREDSPWYPDRTRLFRQGVDEPWETLISRVAAALEALEHPG